MGLYGALFWVGWDEWWRLTHYFGWVQWVGKYFGWVGVGGGECGLVHCLIMLISENADNIRIAF